MRKPILLSMVILILATILSGCFYYAYDDWGGRDFRGGREHLYERGYQEGYRGYRGHRGYDGHRGEYRGYR